MTRTTTPEEAPVIIAGGGPVGLTLALVLAHHGVASTVLERSPTPTEHPKMDLTNGRSMELFRSIGIADAIRGVGVPEDHSLHVVWATSPVGHELYRLPYPSPAEQRLLARERNDGTDTSEPRVRVSQIRVEPLLRSLASADPLIDARFGWNVVGVDQRDGGVTVHAEAPDGVGHQLDAAYLAGCDGGSSTVRKACDIPLDGDAALFRVLTHHFRSDARDALARFGSVYHVQTPLGTLISQDGEHTWTFHGALPRGFDESADPAAVLRERIGADIPFELLLHSYWSPHRLVARLYRWGRVFLAGDAAHQFIPTGGYGMNTGIGDAFDLGWKLAAVVQGWGGPVLLDSYEAERRPVGLRNGEASRHHSDVRADVARLFWREAAAGPLDDDSVDGCQRRERLGHAIAASYEGEYEAWGVEYGYSYDSSPIICPVDDAPPIASTDTRCYVPTTRPGCRLPALYLADGRPLHDLIGPGLTLLVADGADPSSIRAAAGDTGIPLTVVTLPDEPALKLCERRLVLVRPDHHVAWRADDSPVDPTAMLRMVAGRSRAAPPA